MTKCPAPFRALAMLAVFAGPTLPATGQSGSSAQPLYGNLGPYARTITTSSDSAQAYFNEGLQFMNAFGVPSALRSFREAQKHDPDCAMCYWGEAWALSPYLNGGMNVEREKEAYQAIRNAKARAHSGTAVERDLIEAFAVRYAEHPTAEGRRSLDSLYAKAIGETSQRYPDDLDISTLHGESLMLLRPRRGSVDLEDPAVQEILPILEGVLAREIKHPLACHLYIHLVEASPEPGRAEACSDFLGDAIPGASHIRHMPSHIYMNIGRYGDGVRANQNAWHVDQQAAFGGPPGIYPSHNLHMMLFGAVLDGQSAVAIQAAKDLAKISRTSSFYHPVTLAIFGRWDEVLAMHDVPDDPFLEGMWRFARGMSYLRTDDFVSAKADLEHLTRIVAERPDSARFRFHPQPVLLSVPRGILAGEIAAAEGRWGDAVSLLEQAVSSEDALVYDEPEPWHLPARHALGAVLLEMDRGADAERVYREALEDHPNSGWSLFGLAQALEAQGKDAAGVRLEFEQSWARRDIWLRSSRF